MALTQIVSLIGKVDGVVESDTGRQTCTKICISLRKDSNEVDMTHKIPSPRIPPTEIFSLRSSLTCQSRGMGLG